jgi:hypothetical protein
MKSTFSLIVICLPAISTDVRADEKPSEIIQAAIKAHGGEQNIAKTLKGKLYAKAKFNMPPIGKMPAIEGTINWDEIFDIPHRYKRTITGEINGQRGFMEFVVSDEGGWIRRNNVADRDTPAQKTPVERTWHAMVAVLPTFLGEDYKLEVLTKEMVEGHETIALHAKSSQFETICLFDSKSHLLLKCKKKLAHPLLSTELDSEVLFGRYQEISGVKYPMKVTSYFDSKKALELEITKVEFMDKLDPKLFEKP